MVDEFLNSSKFDGFKERLFLNKFWLDSFLENIPKIIYIKDLEGNYINGTKYSKDFFYKQTDYYYKIELQFNTLENYAKEDSFVIQNNKSIEYEAEIHDKLGNSHWYKIFKSPITNYNKEVIGIVVIVENIDDDKLVQGQRETFVASIGHDLKNPTLAQIRALELLIKGEFGELQQESREIIEMVLDSCRYMNAMLSSLLATYRNEKGVVKLNYEDILLTELTEECISEMIYMAKDKNIKITVKENFNNPILYGDKVQIKRVIMNLLSNGIKYAFKNSSIIITIFNQDDNTCFSLENNSPYITPEKQEAIFGRYVTFAEAHKELGIGLGLYASKKIIDAHAGKIFVKSSEDNRNVFVFMIPCTINENCLSTVTF